MDIDNLKSYLKNIIDELANNPHGASRRAVFTGYLKAIESQQKTIEEQQDLIDYQAKSLETGYRLISKGKQLSDIVAEDYDADVEAWQLAENFFT